MPCDVRTYPFVGHHEGGVLKAYRCPAGVVTIGFGFTMGSKLFANWWRGQYGRGLRLGDTISMTDALRLLRALIDSEYAVPVERDAPNATPHAKGAAASMLFNCGLGAAKWQWFAALAAGRIADAAAKIRVTATTANGRRLPGLVRRRQEEAAILESNQWPDWCKAPENTSSGAIVAAMPVSPLQPDDYAQGIKWLVELGYQHPELTEIATSQKRSIVEFQHDHKQLTVDGIMGRATLDQIQRAVDLKRKVKQAVAVGSTPVAAGGAEKAGAPLIDISGAGDWLLYGGLALTALALAYLAYRYRDEIKIVFGKRTVT